MRGGIRRLWGQNQAEAQSARQVRGGSPSDMKGADTTGRHDELEAEL